MNSALMIELPHLRNSVSRRWFHEGRQVFPSPGHRVVMSSGSVLLRNVTREEWGGEWRCRVENQLGSKDVTLNLVVFGKSIRIFFCMVVKQRTTWIVAYCSGCRTGNGGILTRADVMV